MTNITVLATEKVNMAGAWDTFWASIQSDGTVIGLKSLMALVGMLIVVFSIAKWMWSKNKPNGGGGRNGTPQTVIWALACGVLLAAPNLILPPVLTILDTIANGVLSVFNSTQTNTPPTSPGPKTPPGTTIPPVGK